ncbi:hypothetical protein IJJ27_01175 [bacterium]|nr:hypothetical protein [bacterium]
MQTLEDILQSRYAKYGKTDPTLAENQNTTKQIEKKQQEKRWEQAKQKLVQKSPKDWFELILDEWLESGMQGTKTPSELIHYHFLRENGDIYEIDKLTPFEGKYRLTVYVNKKQMQKSYALLHEPELNKLYRYPDWDSYLTQMKDEKETKIKGL